MILKAQHISEYREKGWIVLNALLDKTEISVLNSAVEKVSAYDGPQVAREPNGSPHVVYGMHLLDDRLRVLPKHPAILSAAEQLLDSKIFVHQSRINVKQTDGSIVKWHQDFSTYHRVDGLPRPTGIMIGVFLDDINASNAPVLGIPGSHKQGLIAKAFLDPNSQDFKTVSKYRFDIPREKIAQLVAENGVEPIMAPAGSILLMDMTVVHGSSVNITPLRRVILYINVSTIDNFGETYQRPEYYAARDFSPLEAADDDCLKVFSSSLRN